MAKLTRIFGSKSQTRLLEYVLENPGKVFNQAALSRFLDISPSTVARIIQPLIEEGIIMFDTIGNQMKIIALNEENAKARLLLEFYGRMKEQ